MQQASSTKSQYASWTAKSVNAYCNREKLHCLTWKLKAPVTVSLNPFLFSWAEILLLVCPPIYTTGYMHFSHITERYFSLAKLLSTSNGSLIMIFSCFFEDFPIVFSLIKWKKTFFQLQLLRVRVLEQWI